MMFLCATLGQGSLVHHDNSNYYQASFYHQNMHHHNSQAHHGNHHHHHHGGHHHGSTASPSTLWQLWDLRYENCTSLRPTRHVLQLQQTLYRLLLAIQVFVIYRKERGIFGHNLYTYSLQGIGLLALYWFASSVWKLGKNEKLVILKCNMHLSHPTLLYCLVVHDDRILSWHVAKYRTFSV